MKNIIGGVRIFYILLSIFVFLGLFSPNLNYAQEEAKDDSKRRISMDFQDAPLRDVLKIFSQQAGLNFVAAKEIENKQVTLYLEGVTVQDAMDSILGANNLAYEQKAGSSVFIVKESSAARVKLITKIYSLNYAVVGKKATEATSTGATSASSGTSPESDIKSIIENLLAKDNNNRIFGSVIVDGRTNSLIITSIPEDFPLIESTLAKLDAQTPQVMIEAEIIEVKTTAIKKLGLDWGGTTNGTFFTFSGPSLDTGFPFIRENAPFQRSLLGSSLADTRGRTLSASSTGNQFGNLTMAEFQIVLKALEKENKAKYLARPKIMVLNNETAEIKISADTTVGTISTSQATTGTLTTTAERMETGVILRATPTINKDDFITMTLEPEVSRVEAANITGYWDPQKRSAKTTVMMKDAQTIAIGGLLRNDVTDNNRAVPGISKIPLLGNLFKSKDFQDAETEIIIFVTCRIIRPELEKVAQEAALASAKTETGESTEGAAGATMTDRDQEITKTIKRLRKKKEIE